MEKSEERTGKNKGDAIFENSENERENDPCAVYIRNNWHVRVGAHTAGCETAMR